MNLLEAMLEISTASGAEPRKHLDYWLLRAQCEETRSCFDKALEHLEAAIAWKCTPLARIHEAMDRIESKRLLAKANAMPTVVIPDPEPICAIDDNPIRAPSTPDSPEEDKSFLHKNYEELEAVEPRHKPPKQIIEYAAMAIQSAKPVKVENKLLGTPQKRCPSTDERGSKMVLTPLRASKRVQEGTQ